MSVNDQRVGFEHAAPGDMAEAQKPQGLRKMWRYFGDVTSMNGLGKAIGSGPVTKRIVWTLVVMAATGYAVYNLIAIFQEFSSYPVSTTVSEEYEPLMIFPAVTLCNTNRIRKSHTPRKILDALDNLRLTGADSDSLEVTLEMLLKQYIEKDRMLFSHSLKEMLISCKFDGEKCFAYHFTTAYNTKYGNCYTFNTLGHRNTILPGPHNGLEMEINIQQDEYLPFVASAGFKVVVHPQDYLAFPEEEGLTVAPGFSTAFGLRKMKIVRSPSPCGQCIDEAREAGQNSKLNMFNSVYPVSYTDKVCKKTCYQTHVYATCKCCDASFPCLDEALQKSTGIKVEDAEFGWIPLCNTSQVNTLNCLTDAYNTYLNGTLPCLSQCKPVCTETRYRERMSVSKWPREIYFTNFLQLVKVTANSTTNTFANQSETRSFIGNNLLRIEIFYEQLNYETIVTTPAYDWNRLLSDVGGQLGLWLGFSVMTGLEWMELLLDIFIYGCRSLGGKNSKTTPVHNIK